METLVKHANAFFSAESSARQFRTPSRDASVAATDVAFLADVNSRASDCVRVSPLECSGFSLKPARWRNKDGCICQL